MLGSHLQILEAVVGFIDSAVASHDVHGVQITMVNVLMPDGRAVSLTWQAQAQLNDDGSYTPDWVISASENVTGPVVPLPTPAPPPPATP